jgi:hypothetical protein
MWSKVLFVLASAVTNFPPKLALSFPSGESHGNSNNNGNNGNNGGNNNGNNGNNVTGLPSDAAWFLEQPEFQNFQISLPSFRSGRTLLGSILQNSVFGRNLYEFSSSNLGKLSTHYGRKSWIRSQLQTQ